MYSQLSNILKNKKDNFDLDYLYRSKFSQLYSDSLEKECRFNLLNDLETKSFKTYSKNKEREIFQNIFEKTKR